MADIKYLGKTYSGVSKVKFHNATGNDYTEFSAGGGDNAPSLIDKSISGNYVIPSGTSKVGQYAFYMCQRLTGVVVPSGITDIGTFAFNGCDKLETVVLPSGVIELGSSAFYGCTKLSSINLPSSITKINGSCFYKCIALTEISCDGAITTFGSNVFQGASGSDMQITSIRFPNMDITNLSTGIGNGTQQNACRALQTLDLGKTQNLNANALANCQWLTKLILRKPAGCVTMSNINAVANTPISGYSGRTATVYVPNALIESYKTTGNWKTYYDAGYITFTAIEGSQYELAS